MATPQLNQSELVLNVVAKSIINGNNQILAAVLGRMPLSSLPVEMSDTLLNAFLSIAAQHNQPSAIEPILKAWEQVYPTLENASFYSKMFLKPVFNVVMLKFLAINLTGQAFQTVIDDLISYDASENLTYALERVFDVYGKQTRLRLQNMSSSAESRGNLLVYGFLQEKMEETNEFAPIPNWVKNFTGSVGLPKESQTKPPKYVPPKYQVLNPEDAVNLILTNFSSFGQTFDQDELDRIKDVFRAEYMTTNVFGRAEMLRESLDMLTLADLQTDIQLFRILGPVCLFLHPSPEQLEFGGSRMFLATEFDYDEDDGDDNVPADWFDGHCEHCHLRIRRRWHAVRRPMESGGWKGCFCSFLCCRKDLYDVETQMGFENIAVRTMIDAIEEQMKDIGIQDRVPDGPEESTTLQVIQTGQPVSDDSGEITRFAVDVPLEGEQRTQTQKSASELLQSSTRFSPKTQPLTRRTEMSARLAERLDTMKSTRPVSQPRSATVKSSPSSSSRSAAAKPSPSSSSRSAAAKPKSVTFSPGSKSDSNSPEAATKSSEELASFLRRITGSPRPSTQRTLPETQQE